jgi:hypothetical protein
VFNQIRNSALTKILWGIMGLYLFNISVDTADPYPEHIPEDLSINDQESIIEILVEQVLGYENAFKEYDDHDKEDHNTKANVKFDFTNHNFAELVLNYKTIIAALPNFPNYATYLTKGLQEQDIPPPKI